mmetsp:Transcript_37624/g.70171  ORF Transcript_37624/g.70171 Transcript_37624/m.70171 type:complete len:201 (+) Transcript_37624:749-1351(+)
MVHVVVDGRCTHHLRRHSQIPEVVFVHLRHPGLVFDEASWRSFAAVEETWHFPLLPHSVRHLGNDVFCPGWILSTLSDEVADASPRLHVRDGVLRTVDELSFDRLAAIVRQTIFIPPLDLGDLITEVIHDVLVGPVHRRRMQACTLHDEGPALLVVLLPEDLRGRRFREDVYLPVPRVQEVGMAEGLEMSLGRAFRTFMN